MVNSIYGVGLMIKRFKTFCRIYSAHNNRRSLSGPASLSVIAFVALIAIMLFLPCSAGASWPLACDGTYGLGFHETYSDRVETGSGEEEIIHHGLDILTPASSSILAPLGGTVSFVGSVPSGEDPDGPRMKAVSLLLDSGKTLTLMPFSTIAVEKGDVLSEGEPIGTLAPSGDASDSRPHLHIGLKKKSTYFNPASLIGTRFNVGNEREPAAGVAEASGAPGLRRATQSAVISIADQEQTAVQIQSRVPASNSEEAVSHASAYAQVHAVADDAVSEVKEGSVSSRVNGVLADLPSGHLEMRAKDEAVTSLFSKARVWAKASVLAVFSALRVSPGRLLSFLGFPAMRQVLGMLSVFSLVLGCAATFMVAVMRTHAFEFKLRAVLRPSEEMPEMRNRFCNLLKIPFIGLKPESRFDSNNAAQEGRRNLGMRKCFGRRIGLVEDKGCSSG